MATGKTGHETLDPVGSHPVAGAGSILARLLAAPGVTLHPVGGRCAAGLAAVVLAAPLFAVPPVQEPGAAAPPEAAEAAPYLGGPVVRLITAPSGPPTSPERGNLPSVNPVRFERSAAADLVGCIGSGLDRLRALVDQGHKDLTLSCRSGEQELGSLTVVDGRLASATGLMVPVLARWREAKVRGERSGPPAGR